MSRLTRRMGVAVVILAVLLLGALALSTYRTVLRPAYAHEGVLVVLVIGSDAGPPYRPGDPLRGRADAIHLVAVDVAGRRATVVDIPRDSVIGGTKVNAHLATGGPEALVAELESFTGLTIDHWMLTTFRGFERLTAEIGGVDVMVDEPMHDSSSGSDFEPGPAHVEGATALAFARDRHSLSDGDFGRTRHQGELLLAIHRRMAAQPPGPRGLVDLVATVGRTTVSDVAVQDLLPLAVLAADIAPEAVDHIPLSGRTAMLGDASVVYVEPGDTFARIAAGHVGPPVSD